MGDGSASQGSAGEGGGDHVPTVRDVNRALERFFELGEVEREAGIAQVCGGDAVLEDAVRQRLAFDDGGAGDDAPVGDPDGTAAAPPSRSPSRPGLGSAWPRSGGSGGSRPAQGFRRDFTGAPIFEPGDVVGGCTLTEEVPGGAFGMIWKATQGGARRVVVKMIRPDRFDDHLRSRFEFERRALMRLNHPNIAGIYSAGIELDGESENEADGVPYIIMEYIREGRHLDVYCRDEELSVPARVELVATLADAVEHAHSRSAVHRDLKPANVLVDSKGTLKLIDFGVAKSVGADLTEIDELRQLGETAGTPAYMSPEQCGEEPENLGPRSDVYAVGAILYELLTDERFLELPQGAPYEEKRQRIQGHVPRPPSSVNAGVAAELDAIFLKAVARDPDDRYQTAGLLCEDLRAYLDGRSTSVMADRPAYHLARYAAQRKGVIAAAVAVVLAAVGGLAALAFSVIADERAATANAAAEAEAWRGAAGAYGVFIDGLVAGATEREDDAALASVADARSRLLEWADGVRGQDLTPHEVAVRAAITFDLAEAFRARSRFEVAEDLYRAVQTDLAREGVPRIDGLEPDTIDYWLAISQLQRGERDQNEEALRQAAEEFVRLAERSREAGRRLVAANIFEFLADARAALGQDDREREALEAALAELELAGEDAEAWRLEDLRERISELGAG